MKHVILAALVFVAGCGGSDGGSMIGKTVIVKPNDTNTEKGRVMLAPQEGEANWFTPFTVEAFRAVVIDEKPEAYHKGRLDDFARWIVKAEDGPAAGKVVTVQKPRVDLIPVE